MSAATATATLDGRVDRLATPLDDPATEVIEQKYAAAVHAVLAFTDPIEAHRAGFAYLVPREHDYVGDHRAYALGPFVAPYSSRFSDGSFGVLYAGFNIDTAQEESLCHVARFYLDADFPAGAVAPKRHLRFRVCGELSDLRMTAGGIASLYDPDPLNYGVPQTWGRELYDRGTAGLWYDSVRYRGGECVGVFLPRIISEITLLKRYEYTWDGATFTTRKEITPL